MLGGTTFVIFLWAATSQTCTASSSSRQQLSSALGHDIHSNWFHKRKQSASDLVALEQQVEDYNADWIASASSQAEMVKHRRLLALPLDDRFDPPVGVFSHGHLMTGDKMSLPACFWQAIQLNSADVPWLFAVKRVEGVTGPRVVFKESEDDEEVISPHKPMKELDVAVGGPLDFRAPTCYVFLPAWMMRALGLRPLDIVEVELIETVAAGSMAKLRPHSSQFAKDIANPQAVLETELRHYSSLTGGATIAFDYNGKRYWFDVEELRSAPRGEKQPLIKVQDCDIATDFLPSRESVNERKKKRKQRQQRDL